MANNQCLKIRLGGFSSGTLGSQLKHFIADNQSDATSKLLKFVDRDVYETERAEERRAEFKKVEIYIRSQRRIFVAKTEQMAKQMMADYIEPKHQDICAKCEFVYVSKCGIEGHEQTPHMHIEHQWKDGGQ